MNKTETLRQLKAAGSEQTRKTYRRHGVTAPLFGVRYADIYKLEKRIGTDQRLAEQLWSSGNHDCRVLACMIADPATIGATTLDGWAREIDNHVLIDSVAHLAAKSRTARKRCEKWMAAKNEWLAATGWHTLAVLSGNEYDAFSEHELGRYIDQIEADIHASPNRVRHTMNQALISIGVRTPALQKHAVSSARRIGKVTVDHGDTSCKTPDAVAYIKKTAAYRRKKKTKGRKTTGC